MAKSAFQRFANYISTNFTSNSLRKRRWLSIFPEGGFKYKRMANSKRFAQKQGLPDLEHCTYPRHYGMYSALQVTLFLFAAIIGLFRITFDIFLNLLLLLIVMYL